MWFKKFVITAAMLTWWKQAGATGTTAGIVALQLGVDPWPWFWGGVGAGLAYTYGKPTTRISAISNGVVSILMGGMLAPWAALLLAAERGQAAWNNPNGMALVLSFAWPVALRVSAVTWKKFMDRWSSDNGNPIP